MASTQPRQYSANEILLYLLSLRCHLVKCTPLGRSKVRSAHVHSRKCFTFHHNSPCNNPRLQSFVALSSRLSYATSFDAGFATKLMMLAVYVSLAQSSYSTPAMLSANISSFLKQGKANSTNKVARGGEFPSAQSPQYIMRITTFQRIEEYS